jgi:hypothetical protein
LPELGRTDEGAPVAVSLDEPEHLGDLAGGRRIVVGAKKPQTPGPIFVHERAECALILRSHRVGLHHGVSVPPAALAAPAVTGVLDAFATRSRCGDLTCRPWKNADPIRYTPSLSEQ